MLLFLFPIFTLLEIFYYYLFQDYYTGRVNSSGGRTMYFHLYFMLCISFLWRDEEVVIGAYIYFIIDLLFQYLNKTCSTFTMVHHLFTIFVLLNSEYLFKFDGFFNLITINEVSTIIICLYDLGFISKRIFYLTYPITFVILRLFVFNLKFLLMIEKHENVEFVIVLWVIFLVLNLGITIHLRLINKILSFFHYLKSS